MTDFKKCKFSEREKRFLGIPKFIVTDTAPKTRAQNRSQSNNKIQKDSRKKNSNYYSPEFKRRSYSKEELDEEYLKYAQKVNEKYDKLLKHRPNDSELNKKRYLDLKRCEKCFDFTNGQVLLLCEYCDDGYHIYCLDPPLNHIPEEDFVCPNCKSEISKKKGRQSKIDESIKKCCHCKENIKKTFFKTETKDTKSKNSQYDSDQSLNTCFKCKKDFHSKCFRIGSRKEDKSDKYDKGSGKIMCSQCENHFQTHLKKDSFIPDYFKSKKNVLNDENILFKGSSNAYFNTHAVTSKSFEGIGKKFKFTRSQADDITETDDTSIHSINCLNSIDKKAENVNDSTAKFKLGRQLNQSQKTILKESLFRALYVKNITFNDDLCYTDKECPIELNNSMNEPGIQMISDYNKSIFYKFKERTRRGEYPPLEVVNDEIQGFIVRANDDIQALTLICEYSGDVTLARKKIFDTNDSIMDLIRTPSSNTSLVICPEKNSNLARFISGINNFDKNSKKKQNVSSIRYSIDGQVHILLYAFRNIKKNEILYYDYNAGGYGGYPTENFV